MARTKAFDPKLALSKAMAVFWQQGYTATSIQDLVEAMGIHRGSLYDTFQDKRQLFLQAIALYQDTVVHSAIAPLKAPGASRAEIEQHFWRLAERSAEQPCGCLLTNTLVELASEDVELVTLLNQGLQQVEDAFFQALVRAQDQGEVSAHQDLRTLAHYLTTSLQGVRVMSRLQPSAHALRPTISLILEGLD